MAREDISLRDKTLGMFHTLFGPPDILDLCEKSTRNIEEILSSGEEFLNRRQCQDLSSKLSKVTHNIRELVLHFGSASAEHFQSSLKDLYRCLEKAKLLAQNCAKKEWWVAAVFQSHNQNAFREIVLEVSFCYNTIYEQAKSVNQEWDNHPDDLRQSSASVFVPASSSDVQEDQVEIQQRLEELANDPKRVKLEGQDLQEHVALKAQALAKYLLLTMDCASEQSQATALEADSAIFWKKELEPMGTWGNSHYLGVGATDGGVCRTEWLGIPCAKKEFHVKEYESLFLKEAGIMAHLKHPCVIDFLCCSNGESRGDRFIAMDLMEKSLSDLIESEEGGRISFPIKLDIIVQIARGMLYLHDQGVAHRDLKPQNVVVSKLSYPEKSLVLQSLSSPFLQPNYRARLVDFGTSKTQVVVSKSNTMTYQGIGTAVYRAPEILPRQSGNQRQRKAYWFKADVYSFAMTCVHVLSSKKPFHDVEGTYTKDALYNALMNGVRPKPPLDCPKELAELLKDCWNTIAGRRPTFMNICTRLETLRHMILRGLTTEEVKLERGFDFIKIQIEEYSAAQKVIFHSTSGLNTEEESDHKDLVSVISCTCCKRALDLLPQSPYAGDLMCNICCQKWQNSDPKVYHCGSCDFDAHSECAEVKSHKLDVFFHHSHPLHLLVQDYYNDTPDVVCHFCLEPLQGCDSVYRCEQCDFDVHALCTKYCKDLMSDLHSHTLRLVQCPPRRSFYCTRCNGKISEHTWRYTCSQNQCTFNLHPICATFGRSMPSPCGNSHRLSLTFNPKSFKCWSCGEAGFSWYYHCRQCDDVDIHPDCIDDRGEDESYWIGQYEIVIANGSRGHHNETIQMISVLMDKFPVGSVLEDCSSSLSSGPPSVWTRVQSSIQAISVSERVDAISTDMNLQRQIVVETAERIEVKKTAARVARQKLREKSLEMLDNLEKIILDVRKAHENMSEDDAEVLAATHEKLKRRQTLLKEQAAWQPQSNLCQGPRYGVFFKKKSVNGQITRELLTSLQGGMVGVCFTPLCEEPGHEHIVPGKSRMFTQSLSEPSAASLQPLLASGLHVVSRAMSRLGPNELTDLESVTSSCFGTETVRWDIRALDLETHNMGNRSMNSTQDEEQDDEWKRTVNSAAEEFRIYMERGGVSILIAFGLLRVRYKATEEGDSPKYRRGTLAWLCSDHLNSGLKDGTLESYPLKYFNVEDDYQQRWPNSAMN